jgi:16S rRNA (guanine966-N2)-methyltransferase
MPKLRPTSSRVREAIFSSVEHAVSGLDDLRVLDLFSGSGAFGIESISRERSRSGAD